MERVAEALHLRLLLQADLRHRVATAEIVGVSLHPSRRRAHLHLSRAAPRQLAATVGIAVEAHLSLSRLLRPHHRRRLIPLPSLPNRMRRLQRSLTEVEEVVEVPQRSHLRLLNTRVRRGWAR